MSIKVRNQPSTLQNIRVVYIYIYIFKWDSDKKDIYIQSFNNDRTTQSLINICNDIDLTNSSASLDNCIENFCSVIDDVCSPLFKKTINTQVRGKHRDNNNNRCLIK